MTHILAIDQGTTSSRAIVFDADMKIASVAQEEFPQHFPQSGWVEHDPGDLWSTTAATCRAAIEKAGLGPDDVVAIGITNQRETVVVWDKATGQPVHNAIVWQDRRTADYCRSLREAGHDKMITARTGLLADPYFSATKLKWILDNVDGARERAERGELLFGTVDCFLIWKLTGGKLHATDATNAARTSLYDIHKGRWSTTICDLFDIPLSMLPQVKDCADDFGETVMLDESHEALRVADCPAVRDESDATFDARFQRRERPAHGRELDGQLPIRTNDLRDLHPGV